MGPQDAFEYWCLCIYMDNLGKTNGHMKHSDEAPDKAINKSVIPSNDQLI